MKELTDIPEEVFDYVFKHLSLKDLLRLRKVSKFTKSLADNFIQVHVKEMGGQRKLILDPNPMAGSCRKSVKRYVNHLQSGKLVVPSSNFQLLFISDKCFENQLVKTFGQLCSLNISRLHLDFLKMTPLISKPVTDFLASLQNLKHLTIGCLKVENRDENEAKNASEADAEGDTVNIPLPHTFKNLKRLKITRYQESSSDLRHYVWNFIEDCFQTLEYLAFPPLLPYRTPSMLFTYTQEGVLCITKLIERRAQEFPNQKNLQSLDLGRCQEPYWGRGYDDFFNLIRCCVTNNVKVFNFNSDFLKGRGRVFANYVSQSVASINGLTGSMFLLHLPILETLTIQTRNFSFPTNAIIFQKWAHLRKLQLTIYSQPNLIFKNASQQLLDFIFVGEKREEMKILELDFISNKGCEEIIMYPHPASIFDSCPNLTTLTLQRWPGTTNLDIAMMWTGLPLLEQLRVIDCPNMEYISFVGEDKSQPTFLQLKNLKILELGQLANMPNITDQLFHDVFRHLPLKKFKLWSRGRMGTSSSGIVKWVTLEGILSLLTGEFAKTIEKFKLRHDLMLENVSRAELIAAESKFRSHYL